MVKQQKAGSEKAARWEGRGQTRVMVAAPPNPIFAPPLHQRNFATQGDDASPSVTRSVLAPFLPRFAWPSREQGAKKEQIGMLNKASVLNDESVHRHATQRQDPEVLLHDKSIDLSESSSSDTVTNDVRNGNETSLAARDSDQERTASPTLRKATGSTEPTRAREDIQRAKAIPRIPLHKDARRSWNPFLRNASSVPQVQTVDARLKEPELGPNAGGEQNADNAAPPKSTTEPTVSANPDQSDVPTKQLPPRVGAPGSQRLNLKHRARLARMEKEKERDLLKARGAGGHAALKRQREEFDRERRTLLEQKKRVTEHLASQLHARTARMRPQKKDGKRKLPVTVDMFSSASESEDSLLTGAAPLVYLGDARLRAAPPKEAELDAPPRSRQRMRRERGSLCGNRGRVPRDEMVEEI